MATGYHIRRGYNSNHSKEDVEATLQSVILAICYKPERIAAEALRVEGVVVPPEMVESYRPPWQDLTIIVATDCDGHLVLNQMASGDGESRSYKEALRRAMCRLVIEGMHAVGMEVSLFVA